MQFQLKYYHDWYWRSKIMSRRDFSIRRKLLVLIRSCMSLGRSRSFVFKNPEMEYDLSIFSRYVMYKDEALRHKQKVTTWSLQQVGVLETTATVKWKESSSQGYTTAGCYSLETRQQKIHWYQHRYILSIGSYVNRNLSSGKLGSCMDMRYYDWCSRNKWLQGLSLVR